jgi:hypothetical protein
MFSYPPSLPILARDNLVSGCTCSPTMPLVVGTGSETETAITTDYLAMRLDHLIELIQGRLGVTSDSGDFLATGDDAGDLQSSGGNSVILPATNDAGDSSTARIAEGGDLASKGGGNGIGGLLAVKGSGCNLDVVACDSMAD